MFVVSAFVEVLPATEEVPADTESAVAGIQRPLKLALYCNL